MLAHTPPHPSEYTTYAGRGPLLVRNSCACSPPTLAQYAPHHAASYALARGRGGDSAREALVDLSPKRRDPHHSGVPRARLLVVNKGLEILILPPQLGDGGVALLQRRAQALELCVRRCQLLRHRLHQPAGIGEV